jgi:hypothetical protein
MKQQTIIAVCAAPVALGIVAAFLPVHAMTLDQCRRAHAGYCAYRVVNHVRNWEPGLRARHHRHVAEVPMPVRRPHAILQDPDPGRWDVPPPLPPTDRFTDRHDAIADRMNAIDWNMVERGTMPRRTVREHR